MNRKKDLRNTNGNEFLSSILNWYKKDCFSWILIVSVINHQCRQLLKSSFSNIHFLKEKWIKILSFISFYSGKHSSSTAGETKNFQEYTLFGTQQKIVKFIWIKTKLSTKLNKIFADILLSSYRENTETKKPRNFTDVQLHPRTERFFKPT